MNIAFLLPGTTRSISEFPVKRFTRDAFGYLLIDRKDEVATIINNTCFKSIHIKTFSDRDLANVELVAWQDQCSH